METFKLPQSIKLMFDSLPGAWGCKDLQSRFIYANQHYADIVGLRSKEEIPGRTDFDMPCETVHCANQFQKQDQKVIAETRKIDVLDIHPFDSGWRAYIFSKTPLYDDNGCVQGTIFSGSEISEKTVLKAGKLLARFTSSSEKNLHLGQSSYELTQSYYVDSKKLSGRLSEVLFLLIRGKSMRTISDILGLSQRTIESYVETLKAKFNASGKGDLIELAIDEGYLNFIPKRLFEQQLSVVLED